MSLVAYANCTEFLRQVKAEAVREVGPYGLTGPTGLSFLAVGPVVFGVGAARGSFVAPVAEPAAAVGSSPGAAAGATATAASATAASDYSTTNDQEAGVDEPDMVKTNGQIMVILRQQPLGVQVVDVATSPPQLGGFLALASLGQVSGLFLVGHDAVVLGAPVVSPGPVVNPGGPRVPAAAVPTTAINPGGPMVPAAAVPSTRINPGGPMVPAPSRQVNSGGPTAPATTLPSTYVNPGGPMIPAQPPAVSALGVSAPAPVAAVPGSDGVPVEGVSTTTDAVVVDVNDPAAPVVVRTFSFPGQLQGARLIAGQVVVALTGQPRLRWAYPARATAAADQAATAANRAIVESSTAADWLPVVSVGTGDGRSAATRTAAPACAQAYHPPVAAGVGTVSIVSFDPTANSPGHQVTVLGDAEDVYASATQIYLATTNLPTIGSPPCPVATGVATGVARGVATRVATVCCPVRTGYACPLEGRPAVPAWRTWSPSTTSTTIYGFDISDPAAPKYLGSGQVPGTLIGSYSMSELDGYLRVATTVGEPTPAPADDAGAVPAQRSESMVSVLQPSGGVLATVGALSGLGQGEKIYAVLFQGDLGYVVTFNQLDPLYVVDLSDPGHPTLAGKVSLSGYSSLLQPLGSGLLAGVGQSVDAGLQAGVLQLEVFNVTDPSRPALVSRRALGDGDSSSAQSDPHALLWWPQSRLLVLPVDNYSASGPSSSAQVWSVSSAGVLSHVGDLSQPQAGGGGSGYPEIDQAVVVGSDIYTISQQGVMASDMSSLAQVAWLLFPGGPSS